jgi:hypothetical protein
MDEKWERFKADICSTIDVERFYEEVRPNSV